MYRLFDIYRTQNKTKVAQRQPLCHDFFVTEKILAK